jgi:hypothetical protein
MDRINQRRLLYPSGQCKRSGCVRMNHVELPALDFPHCPTRVIQIYHIARRPLRFFIDVSQLRAGFGVACREQRDVVTARYESFYQFRYD